MSRIQVVDEVMGTVVTINAIDATEDQIAPAVHRLKEIDAKFSTYDPDSEVSRFGRGELDQPEISNDLRTVLDLSETFRIASNGYFDIYKAATLEPSASLQKSTDPNVRPIEPSGVVKGWAIQEAVDVLVAQGLDDFTVNVGGDVYASGHSETGDKWRVGLQHPLEKSSVMTVLEVSDTAVATSGFYERGQHIVSPEDNESLLSVTIVGPDIAMADAYATSALAMGAAGLDWVQQLSGFDFFIVDSDQVVHRSGGLQIASNLPDS